MFWWEWWYSVGLPSLLNRPTFVFYVHSGVGFSSAPRSPLGASLSYQDAPRAPNDSSRHSQGPPITPQGRPKVVILWNSIYMLPIALYHIKQTFYLGPGAGIIDITKSLFGVWRWDNISLDQWTFAKRDIHFHYVHTCFENDRPPFCSHSNFIFADVYTSPAGSTFCLGNRAPVPAWGLPAL